MKFAVINKGLDYVIMGGLKPLGRPPDGYIWDDSESNFVHRVTGDVYNVKKHELVKQDKRHNLQKA